MQKEKPKQAPKEKKEYNFGMVLPSNERVEKKLYLQQQAELQKEKEAEKIRIEAEEAYNEQEKKQKEEEDERRRLQDKIETAKKGYNECVAKLEKEEGNLKEIYSTIYRNTSPYELALANYNMKDGWNFTLLMRILEKNTSLLTLSLSRKNLGDYEAEQLSNMLIENKKLRRLELEGNFFGPEAAKSFSRAIKENVTLRYLDLENNTLTNKGKDISGILELLEALKSNTMLISLNLTNNYLVEELGTYIIECLNMNKTIIHLEIFQNKDFCERSNFTEQKNDENSKFKSIGLNIEHIALIKKKLKNNNDAYAKMRTDEWIERKKMTSNYLDTFNTQIIVDAKNIQEETRKNEQKEIEMLYLDNFNQHIDELEKNFNATVNKYFAETKERMTKKKKKKGKKKKK